MSIFQSDNKRYAECTVFSLGRRIKYGDGLSVKHNYSASDGVVLIKINA